MWNRDEYSPEEDHFIEEHFKLNTSSLVPNKPNILNLYAYFAPLYLGHDTNIHFHFESNVAEEESSFFVGIFVIETNFALPQSMCFLQIF